MTAPVEPAAQWSAMNVQASTPEQLAAAIAAGKLTEMGMPPARRSGHWHDADAPLVSPAAQMVERVAVAAEAAEKARTAPDTLTSADFGALDERTVVGLVESGGLSHLGIGPSRHRR